MAVKLLTYYYLLHLFFLPHVSHHYDSASINNMIEIGALSVCVLVLVMVTLPLFPLILSCQSLAHILTVGHTQAPISVQCCLAHVFDLIIRLYDFD